MSAATAAPPASAAVAPVAGPMKTQSFAALMWRRLRASRTAMIGLVIVLFMGALAALGPFVAPQDYKEQRTESAAIRAKPSADAWFGRDALGRDVFSRLLHGAHLTLGVGVVTVTLAVLIGGGLGLLSGYFGGYLDQIVMRAVDVALALPNYLLALALIAALGPSLMNAMIAVAISFIPKFARIVRAAALQEASRDYITAARTMGASNPRILLGHLLPNCLAPLLVISTLSLGTAILYTSALSFLGLGAQAPAPEWGRMLADGRDTYLTAPHIMIFPGAAIALSVLGINLLGDGLRDALDVRL